MQSKVQSFKEHLRTRYLYLLTGVVFLGACASNVSFDWPESNPFAAYAKTTLEDYPSSGLSKLDLVFSANVFGETDPCGCASGPKGGLDRRLNFLRMEPSFGDRLVLDAGNALFSSENLDPARVDFLKKRASALLQGAQTMGVRAFNVGYLDLGGGLDFLKSEARKYKTPFVSASLISQDPTGDSWFSPYIDLQVSSMNIRVTGLTAGRKDLPATLKLRGVDEALKQVISKGSSANLLVVLSDLGRQEDERLLARDFGIPMVIIGSRDLSSLDRPMVHGKQILVQPQFRGQQWGRLRILANLKSQGWFNLGQAADFNKRWAEINDKYNQYEKRKSGSERSTEMRNQIMVAEELLGQGPGATGENRSVFSYDLIDLGAKFMKSNELSKVMNEVADH